MSMDVGLFPTINEIARACQATPQPGDHRKARPQPGDHRKAKPQPGDHRKANPQPGDHRKIHIYSWEPEPVQQIRGVGSMLVWCWASVIEDVPTPAQHWAKASCLLGGSVYPKTYSREQSYSQNYSREPTDNDVLVSSWFS